MFERFTDSARRVIVHAQEEARALRHEYVGTEHLLLGILRDGEDPTAALLIAAGVDLDTARAEVLRQLGVGGVDERALAAIGIDLGAVRDAVEAEFGEGALDGATAEGRRNGRRTRVRTPFTDRAKKVLELSLREAVRLRHGSIASGHILLGLLREGEGLAARVLAERGLDFAELRRSVEAKLG